MSKVPVFHSKKEKPERHHDESTCVPGSAIPSHEKIAGTGNKPHCTECEKPAPIPR